MRNHLRVTVHLKHSANPITHHYVMRASIHDEASDLSWTARHRQQLSVGSLLLDVHDIEEIHLEDLGVAG